MSGYGSELSTSSSPFNISSQQQFMQQQQQQNVEQQQQQVCNYMYKGNMYKMHIAAQIN